jgi:hypothetical protein
MHWGGRRQKGSGLSTGETSEQANSYLSRLGLVTRHMTPAGRRERIIEGAVFWNFRKLLDLPASLLKSLLKVSWLEFDCMRYTISLYCVT